MNSPEQFSSGEEQEKQAKWQAPTTSGEQEKKQEYQVGVEHEFKVNDLVVPDNYLNQITELLKSNNIRFEVKEITKALPVLDDQGNELATVPGEFVLTILDAEEAIKPATFEYTKEVFELIAAQDLPVRYGKRDVN